MLWRANFIRSQWDEDPESMPQYGFEELPGDADPIVVLNAVRCYRYQTEPTEWDQHVSCCLASLRGEAAAPR